MCVEGGVYSAAPGVERSVRNAIAEPKGSPPRSEFSRIITDHSKCVLCSSPPPSSLSIHRHPRTSLLGGLKALHCLLELG